MKLLTKVLLLICITVFSIYVYAIENIKNLNLNTEELISITKPAIVKIVDSVEGKLEIPNFVFNFNDYTFSPPKKGSEEFISVPINKTVYGTGFIISEDGVIVTNSHVVEGVVDDIYRSLTKQYLEYTSKSELDEALKNYSSVSEAYDAAYSLIYKYIRENSTKNFESNIKVLKPNSEEKNFSELIESGYKAEILYSNPLFADDKKDIAILKIDANKLPTISLNPSSEDNIMVGQKVYAFGYPSSAFLGGSDFLEPTFSQGFINAIKIQNDINFYQTDTKVSEGSSGSPMLDEKGNVIGVLTLISSESSGGDNFGFAIPISLIKEALASSSVNLTQSLYSKNYKSGIIFKNNNHCKKAIEEFNKALDVNPDFSVDKFVRSKINSCEELIALGQSSDSFFAELKTRFKSNLSNSSLWSSLIIMFLLMIILIRRLTNRIRKDEEVINEIGDIIEHDKSIPKKEEEIITPLPTSAALTKPLESEPLKSKSPKTSLPPLINEEEVEEKKNPIDDLPDKYPVSYTNIPPVVTPPINQVNLDLPNNKDKIQ